MRGMTTPIAIEMPLRLEPVTHDSFIDGLEHVPAAPRRPVMPGLGGAAQAERPAA